jgi:protein O-GlcNAc transferase
MSTVALERALIAAQRAEAANDPGTLRLWEEVVRLDGGQFIAWSKIGVLQARLGSLAKAIAAFEAAVKAAPFHAVLHFNLARAYFSANQPHDAVLSYQAALQLNPAYTEAYIGWIEALGDAAPAQELLSVCELAQSKGVQHAFLSEERGRQLLRLRRYAEAIEVLDGARYKFPEHRSLRVLYAAALVEDGRAGESLAIADQILALDPNSADAYLARKVALLALDRIDEALEGLREFVESHPAHVTALRVYGIALAKKARFSEALAPLTEAANLDGKQRDVWEALGSTYGALHQPQVAADCFARLEALQEDLKFPVEQRVKALNQLLNFHTEAMQFAEVVHICDKVRALTEKSGFVVGRQTYALAMLADWSRLPASREALAARATESFGDTTPFSLFAFFDDPGLHHRYAVGHSGFLWGGVPDERPAPRQREAGRPLRVGYLSGDFRDHPVGRLMVSLFEQHDRARVEPVALSTWLQLESVPEAAITGRIRAAASEFIELGELDDEAAATRIRGAELDVLIDLCGHTLGARPSVLARGCAPLQIQYLGFPGTTGAAYLDALIADAHVIPPDAESFYSERVIRLPHSYLPPGDRPPLPPTPARADLGLPEQALVLGAFHSTYKISPEVFDCWVQLLLACPAAILWVNIHDAPARAAMAQAAAAAGIEAHRVIFAEREADIDRHLARMGQIDLMLDTFPYGSHSAALDALWAGAPILVCEGRSFASRVCGGLLRELGLSSLITHSLEEYTRRGIELLADPAHLSALRQQLLAQKSNPVFDAQAHARGLEDALLQFVREREEAGLDA